MGKDREGNHLPKGITQRTNGVYRGRYQHEGVIYTVDDANLKAVIRKLEDLKYEVLHGVRGKADSVKLDQWFDVWLNIHKKKSIKESTYARYDDYYCRYIKKLLGKKKVATITPLLLEQLFQDMAEKDYSTKTIRDVYNILNAMFKYAKHNRIIVFNPCEGVNLPKTKTKDIRVLTLQEQQEVIQHAKGRFYENLILTALGTGMRAGELLGLTWDDVDFRKREIRVNKTLVHIKDSETKKYVFKYQTPKTKNGTRTIPMQDSVYKALKRQYVQIKEMQLVFPDWNVLEGFSNLVFTTKTGRPVTERNFQVAVDNVAKAIDKERSEIAEQQNTEFVPIPHMYPHAFRHTFATRCFEAGIEAKIVQGYLGHYSTAITMDLYTHVTDDMAKKEMEKLNSLFAG